MHKSSYLILGVLALVGIGLISVPASANTFVVNTTNEPGAVTINGVCDDSTTALVVDCTLREAMAEANANLGVPDTITFDIPSTDANCAGTAPARVCTIKPTSALPVISDIPANGTIIDGLTQATVEPNNCQYGTTGRPCIVVDGINAGSAHGFEIASGSHDNVIKGLVIINFCASDSGIHINTNSTGNTIRDNFIGIAADGTTVAGNCSNGVTVEGKNNTVGPNNVISGNDGHGVKISADSNTVKNNIIGLDFGGTLDKGNSGKGVYIDPSNDNVIGPGNVISGNNDHGVFIVGDRNKVIGNIIGLNAAGTAAIGNGSDGDGVEIDPGNDNEIGGQTLADRNVISGNTDEGIEISGSSSSRNEILDNIIGLGVDGVTPLGNTDEGIEDNGTDTCIGGRDPDNASSSPCAPVAGELLPNGSGGNLISGNTNGADGITLRGSGGASIFGNFIGTDITGTFDKGNADQGIDVGSETPNNIIGGTDPKARNLISGNGNQGIFIASSSNSVLGNIIGLDRFGNNPIPNDDDGVDVDGDGDHNADNNCIGGLIVSGVCTPSAGSGNTISANKGNGVSIQGQSNTVVGNTIGLAADGSTDQGNTLDGVRIYSGDGCENSNNNVIGGTTVNHRNVISGNGLNGVHLTSDGDCDVDDNSILGNFIGTNATGTDKRPNDEDGVHLDGPSAAVKYVLDDTCIGGLYVATSPGSCIPQSFTGSHLANGLAGNLISGNGQVGIPGQDLNGDNGIEVTGGGVEDTAIISNFIGTNAAGTSAIPNRNNGIFDNNANLAKMIGTTCIGSSYSLNGCSPVSGVINGRNVISGNLDNGIKIACAVPPNCETGNTVDQIITNYIGTNFSGTVAIPNGADGIFIDPDSFNTIGGNVQRNPLVRNVISGNLGNGVHISGVSGPPLTVTSTDNRIQGNFIGTAANGSAPLGNGLNGVLIEVGSQFNLVGVANSSSKLNSCTDPFVERFSAKLRVTPAQDNVSSGNLGFGNVIAFNTLNGVQVDGGQTFQNTIRCNSIHDNGGKGISLTNGANNGILPPTVTATLSIDGKAKIGNTVDGYNDNNGEGQTVIGQDLADTNCDGAGVCEYHINGSNPLPNATATQTDNLGDTSEFSNSLTTLNCLVTATSHPTTLKFSKWGSKYAYITVKNQGILAADIAGIAGLIAKSLSITQIKFGKKTLLPPFDIVLPPATQQTFKVRLKSSVKQTVAAPYVNVVGFCGGFDFNVPAVEGDEIGLISAIATALKVEELSVSAKAGQIVAEASGLGIQSVQLQVYDTTGRMLADQAAVGAKVILAPQSQLANGVYLAVLTVRGFDGKSVRSEVKKVLIVR